MSFAALALRARAANDTTRAQINNIPSKSHFIVLLTKAVALCGGIKKSHDLKKYLMVFNGRCILDRFGSI